MAIILETGYTWREKLNGVFDPDDNRLIETFGAGGYADYDGIVYPIIREYTVTGTRYNRFGDLVNTTEYTEWVDTPDGQYVLEMACNGGTYLRQCVEP